MELSKEEKMILEILVINELNYYKDVEEEEKTKLDNIYIKQLNNILKKLNKESDKRCN